VDYRHGLSRLDCIVVQGMKLFADSLMVLFPGK